MLRSNCCLNSLLLLLTVIKLVGSFENADYTETKRKNSHDKPTTLELPRPLLRFRKLQEDEKTDDHEDFESDDTRSGRSHPMTLMDMAVQLSVREGIEAMRELYGKIEPEILKNGQLLAENHPAAILSKFSAPTENTTNKEMAAYAAITATKAFKKNFKQIDDLARQAHNPKISLRRTALEGLCPPRDPPICTPASERYRTHDGTCNNQRRLRWGAAQMPFNRFLPPEYGDGVDTIRNGANNMPLSSSRFVSLLVHGAKDGEAPLTLMIAQWGQLLDHDMTSTAQPKSINGSVPSCCGGKDFHPSCFPIKVPLDDPWLAPLKVRCLEFLRSAPAQRRDCVLSWREQTNQATSFIDASPIYSSSTKSSDNARAFRKGLLIFGRGNAAEDVCQRGALARQCIRSGDGRSGEQPGLLALHQVWVGEHNRIATELSELNLHWSDEKIYQEARRIVGAMFQHITYREFLPLILGREVCKLFELDLQPTGYYDGYDPKTNPTVANSFAAAAFRFGHSLIQDSYMRCDRHHNRINNSVSLHEEFQRGDIGSAGSLHRLIRGLATQRALKRDEFISPELTNHLFQTPGFPFGLDLAAINIQRGRDHGIAPYTSWRVPCGLTPINTWNDFANIVGPESAKRIGHAYRNVHDIDLFVGGISERPVVGGLVGPTFACIIAQQFSNSRNGDRFWYENRGFESSFTPAQLHSLRRVSLAQVLCRTVGGGTFQPNIFIPHVFPGNERLPCGTGPLAPIDLGPWLEQDPFGAPQSSQATVETTVPDKIFNIISDMNSLTGTQQMKEDKTGFNSLMSPFANISIPQEQHMTNTAMILQRPLNASKINDKLDFKRKSVSTKRPTQRPIKGVNNKLEQTQVSNFNIKSVNHVGRLATTTRRTVVINNIPIELRAATTNDTLNTNLNTTKKEKAPTRLTTDKKKKKNKNNAKNTNKLKGRADNVKVGQSKANLTPLKALDIFGEEHGDANFTASMDEFIFEDEHILSIFKERTDPTETQIVFESKTINKNEPRGASGIQNQKDNMDILKEKANITTYGGTEEYSFPTTTTTALTVGTNLQNINITTERNSIRNDIVEIEPLDSVKNSTQKDDQEFNKQLKPEQKKTNKTENNVNSRKDIPATKKQSKTKPKSTNETENDPNSHKDNPETKQQLNIEPKKTNETEKDTNLQKDNPATEHQLKTEAKMTNQTEIDKNLTQKDDQENNVNLKTEQNVTNQTENDKNSRQKDNPATNQQIKTELKKSNQTKYDTNSKKNNPETKHQFKTESKKTTHTENDRNTQKDNPRTKQHLKIEPNETNKTENDENSTLKDDQESNENFEIEQNMTKHSEKYKHSGQKDNPTSPHIRTELKQINQTEHDKNSQKENPETKMNFKIEPNKSNILENDTNSQKDNPTANQEIKLEPNQDRTKTNKTENEKNSAQKDNTEFNQHIRLEQKKTNETENDKNSTRKDNSADNEKIKPEPTKTNETENGGNTTQTDNTATNTEIKSEPIMTIFNETVSLAIPTKDVTKNQTEKEPESLTTEQALNKFKLKLTSTSVPQTNDTKPQSRQKPEQRKEDTDIDPLTYSTAKEHKRVQRKATYSKTNTELRNVTNPKLLRVNITNQSVKLVTAFKLLTLRNRTSSTTKAPQIAKLSKTTEHSLELRQYPTRPIYTRPQKVILEGPHSDQYEIEINIRQTNRSPAIKPTLSYADYTTSFKPFGYDRYTNYADYQSTTPAYGYYQPDSTIASNFVQAQRTRPPTVIYLDEHDDRTTTKQPSLLQNFLSFAASGFGANRRPTGPSNSQKEKDKPIFSHNNGGLTSTLVSSPHNSASLFGPEPQRQPIASSSFSQVGNAYVTGNGAAHATSGAVSSGNFGSIMGIANANGADSTFSFNIRPRPPSDSSASSLTNSAAGSYGLAPLHRPAQFSRPDYNNLPIASYPNEQYFAQQTLEASHSPFSTTGNKKPLQQSYFSRFAMDAQEKTHNVDDISNPTHHKIDVYDFDYLSKTLEPIVNGDSAEDDSDDLDNDYAYDDIDQQDDDSPSKKFNRDGYIRPEFMIASLLKNQNVPLTNITQTNNSSYLLDDNFVLPVLNSSKITNNDLPTPIAVLPEDFNFTKTTTNPADSLPKHLNNDILAEDYDDDSNGPIIKPKTTTITTPTTSTKKTETPVQHASFAPIKILTKPERPDHWVIYETPVEKPLLPEIPEIKSETFSALEVPMPFASLTNAWLTKYRNKLAKETEDSQTQTATQEHIATKTKPDITKGTTNSKQVNDLTYNRHVIDMDKTTVRTEVKMKTDNTEYLMREDISKTIPLVDSTVHARTDTKPERDLESNMQE